MSEIVRDKVQQAVDDQMRRLGELLKSRDTTWSTKNFTLPLENGVEVEVDVKVRLRKLPAEVESA